MRICQKACSPKRRKFGTGWGSASLCKIKAAGLRNGAQKREATKSATHSTIAGLFVHLRTVLSAAGTAAVTRAGAFRLVLDSTSSARCSSVCRNKKAFFNLSFGIAASPSLLFLWRGRLRHTGAYISTLCSQQVPESSCVLQHAGRLTAGYQSQNHSFVHTSAHVMQVQQGQMP